MEDIRAEQQEEDTALNSSFASEEGDEMPPTPAKEPTAAAIRRSSIYTTESFMPSIQLVSSSLCTSGSAISNFGRWQWMRQTLCGTLLLSVLGL
jgi:hypothetical protein